MTRMLLALILALAVAAPARADENKSGPRAAEPKQLTVADVFSTLGLDESKLQRSDEPPGKLRALEGEVTLRDTRKKVHIRIELVYTIALFSAERTWDSKAVRAAAVRQVVITPIDSAR